MKNKNNRIKPEVSVVIPVFNGAHYLVEAVESVQKSTFRNFEILLIDDGSTDKSKILCHELEKKYKNITFYSFEKNKGLGRVLNFALDKARGKYISRLNQDDRMFIKRMGTQVEFLKKNPKVVAVGSCIRLFDENNKWSIVKFLEKDSDIKKIWHIVSPFSDPSVMYRKDIAKKAGGYKQEFWPADDTHLWYRMGLLGKLANIQEPLVAVRWHKNAASVKYFRKLMISTYRMHRWANSNVSKAPIGIQIYWIIQLVSGMIFSPDFNWKVYRFMKKIIGFASGLKKTKVTSMPKFTLAKV